ncbi:hypothetical protein [Kiloniella spongiae]|nr:hypothetical protein [Kiloniella spongiae]
MSFSHLKLNIGLAIDLSDDQAGELTLWAQKSLPFPGTVTVMPHKELKRSANGKLELFQNLID